VKPEKRDLGYEAMRYLIDEVVFIHDADRQIVFVSPSVENVLGYTVEQFERLVTTELLHPDDMRDAFEAAQRVRARPGATYRSILRVRRADGSFVWAETVGRNLLHTDVRGIINTLRDISERRALEEQLFVLAFEDELTRLPNRRAFVHQLEVSLKQCDGAVVGVMIVDLDGFKSINDRLGHDGGDALLAACAAAIQQATRDGDFTARLGGDEFAVLCRDLRDEHDLRDRAEKIRSAACPRAGASNTPSVTFSVGASMAMAGDGLTDLLRAADRALYAAKRAGRDSVSLSGRRQGS